MAHNSLFRDRFPLLQSPGIIRSLRLFRPLEFLFLRYHRLRTWINGGDSVRDRKEDSQRNTVVPRDLEWAHKSRPSFDETQSSAGGWIIFHPYAPS